MLLDLTGGKILIIKIILIHITFDINLKDRFSIDSWENQVKRLMNEIDIYKRSIINTYFQSEIDGLEDGFYVFIEYQVSYSNTKSS